MPKMRSPESSFPNPKHNLRLNHSTGKLTTQIKLLIRVQQQKKELPIKISPTSANVEKIQHKDKTSEALNNNDQMH